MNRLSSLAHRVLDLLGVPPLASTAPAVVSQAEWHDAARRRIAEMRATEEAIAKEHYRVSTLVGAWARECVLGRFRASFSRVIGRDGAAIALWLPGLNTAEIMKIAAAPALDVEHHLFHDHHIIGVRPVQPLEECPLVWPKPVLNADQQQAAGAGGGPRRK